MSSYGCELRGCVNRGLAKNKQAKLQPSDEPKLHLAKERYRPSLPHTPAEKEKKIKNLRYVVNIYEQINQFMHMNMKERDFLSQKFKEMLHVYVYQGL